MTEFNINISIDWINECVCVCIYIYIYERKKENKREREWLKKETVIHGMHKLCKWVAVQHPTHINRDTHPNMKKKKHIAGQADDSNQQISHLYTTRIPKDSNDQNKKHKTIDVTKPIRELNHLDRLPFSTTLERAPLLYFQVVDVKGEIRNTSLHLSASVVALSPVAPFSSARDELSYALTLPYDLTSLPSVSMMLFVFFADFYCKRRRKNTRDGQPQKEADITGSVFAWTWRHKPQVHSEYFLFNDLQKLLK